MKIGNLLKTTKALSVQYHFMFPLMDFSLLSKIQARWRGTWVSKKKISITVKSLKIKFSMEKVKDQRKEETNLRKKELKLQ